ncbi:MAG: hypothetical protein ABIS27_11960 [Longimicrobiales bacterium]
MIEAIVPHEVASHMDASRRQVWLRAALVFGVVYFLIGRLFPQPADHVRIWRLAAWVVSGIVYAVHIGYEHFRLRNAPRTTALHVAVAVAIGGFGLALAGMIRSSSSASTIRPVWLLALVAWPALTAIPAFLGAFAAAAILRRFSKVDAG